MIAKHHAIIKRSINCFNLTKDMKINTIIKTIVLSIIFMIMLIIDIITINYNTTLGIIISSIAFIAYCKLYDKLL